MAGGVEAVKKRTLRLLQYSPQKTVWLADRVVHLMAIDGKDRRQRDLSHYSTPNFVLVEKHMQHMWLKIYSMGRGVAVVRFGMIGG